MINERNFAINKAGPIFWWDVLTPLTLLVAWCSRCEAAFAGSPRARK